MPYIGQRPSKGDENNFKILDDISSYTLTFDGSDSSVVSDANDAITSLTHRFVQGQRVTYNNGGGSNIGGLTDGTVYFIIKEDHNTIKLATSENNANNGTVVPINGVGGGSSHTLNVAFDGVNTKFKATHTNGVKAKITRAAQLVISINGVIQQPHDTATPSTGFGFDLDGTIVFSQAPVSTDEYWAHVLTNNNVTFDISDNDIDNFTGNGSTVSFNLSKTPPDNRNVLVTIDGVIQYPNDPDGTVRSYTVVENVLTFVTAPASGVEIQVRHIGFAGSTSGSGSGGVTSFYGRTGAVVLKSTDNIVLNDATASGDIQAANVTVTGDLTVQGTTTTLDTVLTEVDKLEVGANNTNYAGIITQTGTGNILGLFDGSSRVFNVADGGAISTKSLTVSGDIDIIDGDPRIKLTDSNASNAYAFIDGQAGKLKLFADLGNDVSDSEIIFGVDGSTPKMVIKDTGKVGIGSEIPADKFDVNGNVIFGSKSTADAQIQLGRGGSGDRNAYIDLVGDDTYTDYGLRLIRANGGANASSQLVHRGTGTFSIQTTEAAQIDFRTNGNNDRLSITSVGNVGITTNDPQARLDVLDTSSLGILSRSANTQATDTNKALKVRNNSTTDTFNVSYKGQGYFAGKVGIGTNNPDSILHLQDSNHGTITLQGGTATSDLSLDFQTVAGVTTARIFSASDQGDLRFYTANDERVRIKSDGTINIITANGSLEWTASSGSNPFIRSIGSGQQSLEFNTGGDERLRIDSDGRLLLNGMTAVDDFMLQMQGAGGTAKVPAILFKNGTASANEIIGGFTAYNTSNEVATIYAKEESANDDAYLQFSTTKTGGSLTERLRITSEGEVKINYAAAGQTVLSCEGLYDGGSNTSVDIATFARQGNAVKTAIRYNDPTTSMRFGTTTTHDFGLMTGGTERLHVSSTGPVGIGTENPATTLDVRGDVAVDYNATHALRFYTQPRNNWSSISNTATDGNANLSFKTAQGEAMHVSYSKLVGIGTDNPTYVLHTFTNGVPASSWSSENDRKYNGRFTTYTPNRLNFDIYDRRWQDTQTHGWEGTEKRLEYNVDDNTTKRMWMSFFNPSSTVASNVIRFGEQEDTEWIRIHDGKVGINTDTFDYAGAGIRIDGRDFGTSHWPTLQIKGVGSGGVHAAVDLVATSDNNSSGGNPSQYRGLGVLMHDEPADNEWFAGRPYAGSDEYIIGRKSGGYRAQSAEKANALFTINSDGHLFAPSLNSGSGHADVRYVTSNGQFFYDSSTRLVKTDIEDCSYGLTEIKQLKPRIYKRTDADNVVEIGLIADEVQSILPEIVATEKKSFFTKNESDTEIIPSNVDLKRLTVILTKAIQEQQEQIETLKSKVATLEGS